VTEPANPLALRCRVARKDAGTSLVNYLAARFRYLSAAAWRAAIEAGSVQVNERAATPDQRLPAEARVTYWRQHAEPWVDRGYTIVHQDPHLVVVDKPAHLPVHADGPFVRNTLVHLLRTDLAAPELDLVHRLDRETSGLCLLARNAASQRVLRAQFAAGTVRKCYRAVVRGLVHADFTADAPIGRAIDSSISLRRATGERAMAPQPATTRFQVEAHGPAATLLRCLPATGRTHQIRVHLEAHGTPILGDKLYGRPDADYLAFVARVKASGDARQISADEPDRQLLHAAELGIDHPVSGAAMVFTAPLPEVFEQWLQRWR
jgi:23S rRNA pseudouridine1911/1915/1917 synthase